MSMNAVDVGDKRLAVLVHLNGMEAKASAAD